MLIFAEGTTTNGKYLLPFKRSAFLSKVCMVLVEYGSGSESLV